MFLLDSEIQVKIVHWWQFILTIVKTNVFEIPPWHIPVSNKFMLYALKISLSPSDSYISASVVFDHSSDG